MKACAGHPSIPLKDVLYLSGFALLGWCRPAETGQAHVRIYWTAWHSARGLCCHISLLGGPRCWMPVTGYWQLQLTTCSSASGYGWPGLDSAGPHASLAAKQSAPSTCTHTHSLFCFNKLTLKCMLTTETHKNHTRSFNRYLLKCKLHMHSFHTPPVPTNLRSNHTPRFPPFFSPSFYVLPLALSVWSAKCPDVPSELFIRQDFLKTPHGTSAPLLQRKRNSF